MTTHQGVAVLTETLRQIASDALLAAVPDASVTVEGPEEAPAARRNEARLNIYLFEVSTDAAMRNGDHLPLRLRYLFSYFGPARKAQLMLGAMAAAMHQSPVIDPGAVARAVEGNPDLQGSGLEAQQPPVRITPSSMTLEELAQLWSGLQVPYTLSTVYEAAPVVISGT